MVWPSSISFARVSSGKHSSWEVILVLLSQMRADESSICGDVRAKTVSGDRMPGHSKSEPPISTQSPAPAPVPASGATGVEDDFQRLFGNLLKVSSSSGNWRTRARRPWLISDSHRPHPNRPHHPSRIHIRNRNHHSIPTHPRFRIPRHKHRDTGTLRPRRRLLLHRDHLLFNISNSNDLSISNIIPNIFRDQPRPLVHPSRSPTISLNPKPKTRHRLRCRVRDRPCRRRLMICSIPSLVSGHYLLAPSLQPLSLSLSLYLRWSELHHHWSPIT